ncbi:protein of unknown function [Kyrpidia spormannii]|uniref:Uncharacterized protein n=1 Tax=Kyrpidia spormannii TaxID=2055160 RepID=A0ACA8ZBP0_9BACL|nr:protein of unknown function [Kyrpidia spormannii]
MTPHRKKAGNVTGVTSLGVKWPGRTWTAVPGGPSSKSVTAEGWAVARVSHKWTFAPRRCWAWRQTWASARGPLSRRRPGRVLSMGAVPFVGVWASEGNRIPPIPARARLRPQAAVRWARRRDRTLDRLGQGAPVSRRGPPRYLVMGRTAGFDRSPARVPTVSCRRKAGRSGRPRGPRTTVEGPVARPRIRAEKTGDKRRGCRAQAGPRAQVASSRAQTGCRAQAGRRAPAANSPARALPRASARGQAPPRRGRRAQGHSACGRSAGIFSHRFRAAIQSAVRELGLSNANPADTLSRRP